MATSTYMKHIKVSKNDHFFILPYDNNCWITLSNQNDDDKIHINGISLNKLPKNHVNDYVFTDATTCKFESIGERYVIYIHFDDSVDTNLTVYQEDQSYTITHSQEDDINATYKPCEMMLDHNTSFQLLRVNPKLTGNIKVVVDSNGHLYLDTFKVSKGLSQRKYRKVKINPSEYYGMSVMSQMKGLSSDDIYKIEDSCYSLFSTVNNVGDSYYDTYNSGVRTNTDKLYNENYSLLAPLCIRKNLPDFFLVFKCHTLPKFTTDEARLSYMIQNGTLVKSFDMRKDSDLGTYIRNIYNKSKDFPGYMFTSYDYDAYNIYNGISIDRGVLAPHYESSSYERNIKNQVSMNDWYTLGFERNRIIAKDIINLEFMFDDQDEDLFSISNYFGLYVRLNGEDSDFSCINTDISFIGGSYEFDTVLKGQDFSPSEHKNIIYGFSEPYGFHRLFNNITEKHDDNPVGEYTLKPYRNILSSDIIKHQSDISYIKFRMDDVFEAGEHYRIIDKTLKIVYDVIMSNTKSVYDISDVSYDYTDEYEIRKVSVHNIGFRNGIEKNNNLRNNIIHVKDAFNKMNPDIIYAETNEKDSISIIYKRLCDYTENPDLIFQRILSDQVKHKVDDNVTNYNDTCDKSCKILNIESGEPFVITNNGSCFDVIGFESLGERLSFAVSFIPTSFSNYEICIIKNNIDEVISNYNSVIYKTSKINDVSGEHVYNYTTANNTNNFIKIYNGNEWENVYVTSIIGPGKDYTYSRFFSSGEMYPETSDGILRLYQNYPLNAGICSIFPVKDFYTNVLDTRSQISYNEIDGNISSDGGRFTSPDNLTSKTILDGEEEYFCDYIDKHEIYKSNDSVFLNRMNSTLSNYVAELSNSNINKSDISLIVPYCCKWEAVGTDSTGKALRVMYPFTGTQYTSLVDNSYNIATNESRGVGYIASSNSDAMLYTEKHVNDGLYTKNHHDFRDYILNGNGSLNDILHIDKNNNVTVSRDTSNKWSRVYKHDNNTIEFVSGGVKIQVSSSNETIIDVTKYNGYSGILICMCGNNPLRENSFEFFVDETKEQLAVIYYNGTLSSDSIYTNDNTVTNNDIHVYGLQLNKPLSKAEIEHNGDELQISVSDDGCLNDGTFSVTSGKLFLSSPVSDYETYTKEKYNIIMADVDGLFNVDAPNRIVGTKPVIISDSNNIVATNGNIINELDKLVDSTDAFLLSDSVSSMQLFQTLGNLKTKGNDVAVYIKKQTGTKNYSGKNSIINIDAIDPLTTHKETENFDITNNTALVHPTYCVPMFKDIFNFTYNDNEISNISKTFNVDFRGCNTIISSDNTTVEKIPQMWIRKYIFGHNSELVEKKSMTLALIKNFSVLQSCLENDMFRTYTENDNYTVNNGVDSGYEKNTFFGSRGLQLKTGSPDNTITITSWVDTVVDENNKTVRLNVTESIINYITFSDGFKSNWTGFNSTEAVNKTKYIKNSILKHINVSANCIFKLFTVENSTLFKFFDYTDDYNYKQINNPVNKLVQENDTYYIEIDNLDAHVYSATLTIKL